MSSSQLTHIFQRGGEKPPSRSIDYHVFFSPRTNSGLPRFDGLRLVELRHHWLRHRGAQLLGLLGGSRSCWGHWRWVNLEREKDGKTWDDEKRKHLFDGFLRIFVAKYNDDTPIFVRKASEEMFTEDPSMIGLFFLREMDETSSTNR